jgi:hypothetical protein
MNPHGPPGQRKPARDGQADDAAADDGDALARHCGTFLSLRRHDPDQV